MNLALEKMARGREGGDGLTDGKSGFTALFSLHTNIRGHRREAEARGRVKTMSIAWIGFRTGCVCSRERESSEAA